MMIICNIFELSAKAVKRDGKNILDYVCYTDLPPQTRAIVTLRRTFLNARKEECIWNGFNFAEMLAPGVHGDYAGLKGEIDIAASDLLGAEQFRAINQTFSSGIATKVSDELTLIVTVGARQRLKEFGTGNAGLSGMMVANHGGIRVVEGKVNVVVPMAEVLQPLRAT